MSILLLLLNFIVGDSTANIAKICLMQKNIYMYNTHIAATVLTPLTTHPQMQAELPITGQVQEQPEIALS